MPDQLLDRLSAFFASGASPITSVYLFGSRAEGRAHSDSDVDVGVLFDEGSLGTRDARAEAAIVLNSDLIAVTHVNCVDVVVLNDAPAELAAHVLRTGLLLKCTDSARDHDFTRRILLRAADLQPFLRRMRRIKLDALRQ